MTMTATKPRYSQRSVDYLIDLVKTRQAGQFGTTLEQDLVTLTKWLADPTTNQKAISAMIDRVKAKPRRFVAPAVVAAAPRPYVAFPAIPAEVLDSRYAVFTDVLTEIPSNWKTQEHLFFEVKKFRGKRTIRKLTGAPGRFTRSFIPAALAVELLGHLENREFAKSSSDLFGFLYTCCGTCGAELTDDMSVELSQGPICRKRWGL